MNETGTEWNAGSPVALLSRASLFSSQRAVSASEERITDKTEIRTQTPYRIRSQCCG